MLVLPSAIQAQRTHILNPKLDSLFPERPTNYLTDVANIVRNPEAVNTRLKEIREKDSLNLVVVTLPSIGEYDIADVAREIGRKWLVATRNDTIGTTVRNTGGVILLVPSIRKCRVEVANGSEGYMTDSRAAAACRAASPSFKAGEFGAGFITIANAFDEYHREELRSHAKPKESEVPSSPFPWGTVFIVVVAIGIPFSFFIFLSIKRSKAQRAEEDRLEMEREIVRRSQAKEAARLEGIRRHEAEEAERRRWNSLTPTQQAAERAENARRAEEAERQARINADRRRQHEAENARRREESYQEERRTTHHTSIPHSDPSPSPSISLGGSDAFSGGGGGSEY